MPDPADTSAASEPPLAGMRVLELATGIAGPFAGRLLAGAGATVVKVEPPSGDPARRQPVDDVPLQPGELSPLYVHLNAGKLNCPASDVDPSWPDVVIASDTVAGLAGGPWDPQRLAGRSAAGERVPKLVTVTAWGADADNPGVIADELLVQTATGFLGFNGDEGAEPLRLPGWQAQYTAGGLAAWAAHLILRRPEAHMDVSWLGALLTAVELCYCDALHCERPRPLVGPHPPTAYPSGAIRCADGYVCPGSLRRDDWEMQCLHIGVPEWIDDPELSHRHRRARHIEVIREVIEPWYAARTKRDLFQFALDTPWAVGMVMTPLDALNDEHLAARGFLGDVATPSSTVTAPIRPFAAAGLPVPSQRVSDQGIDPFPAVSSAPESSAAAGALDSHRAVGSSPADGSTATLRPAHRLRVIEMTIAWAGPYIGNLLTPLGIDVIKIEAQNPFDGFRTQRPYDHGMAPGLEHLVNDNRFFEAGGHFNAVNKGKRDCVVTLATPEGRAAFLELVRNCDGIVANFSAHVLPQLGLDFDTLAEANPRIVLVRMPAFGVDGPYSNAVGYGSIIEAMGGLGHRQGYEHEGARISNIYFPDPIAGIAAGFALLSGLQHAERTGRGIEIDVSQQEGTWQHSGEAIVLASLAGRDIGRMGNREPGAAWSGFIEGTDGWLAVMAEGSADDPSLGFDVVNVICGLLDEIEANGSRPTRTRDGLQAILHPAGARTEICRDPWTAPAHEPLASHIEVVEHPVTGDRRHIASPFTLDGTRPSQAGPSPLFDQHTDEVMAEVAGLTPGQIADLRAGGHIGGELPPPAELGFVYD
ncbi:CoA transferase [Candidatus Poriferisodalis sp.]|uniref:CaiB/BaiF CoA-transferase family protein n=1 Tax=Candidatus Poriferisodalis sp. TaxID=3101277 RepID=UPI003B01A9EB